MNTFETTPRLIRLLTLNLFVQCAIIVTGAVVRITKSGLGCPTWPQCVGDSIIPLAEQDESWHKYVEFGNRMLTFVLVIVAAFVVISVWRNKALKSLRLLSLSPFLGTLIQAVLGGITVLTGLHPTTVAAHFMTSILIVGLSHKLLRNYKAQGRPDSQNSFGNILALNALVVVALGTLVTGSGPHSGDAFASSRFDFDLETMASIHAKSIWLFCILLGWFGFRELSSQNSGTKKSFYLLTLVVFVQGLIGYVQFAQGVPELLVFIHIIGAAIFWVAALRLRSDLMQDKRV